MHRLRRLRLAPLPDEATAHPFRFWTDYWAQHPRHFAFVVGGLSALVSLICLLQRGGYAGDFTWAWRAARLLIHGHNPYHDPGLSPIFPYPFDAPLFYPLPAVVVAAPFALLPAWLGGPTFFGICAGTLAYLIARKQEWRLVPLLVSAPFYVAASVAQWSPLIVAAALAPALAPLALAKPNLGIPVLITHGDRRQWLRALYFVVLTLPLLPSWPLDWLHNLQHQSHYPMPLQVFPGIVLLLALLRWHDPAARLLLAMAIMPQRLWFYDQLPLWLMARSWREGLFLTVFSWIGYWGWRLTPGDAVWKGTSPEMATGWIIGCIYLPALAVAFAPPILAWWRQRVLPLLLSAFLPTNWEPPAGER